MARPTIPNEHAEQVDLINWWRVVGPAMYGIDADLLFAVPNGGLRHIGTARKLRAEGVVAGVADLFLAVPAGPYHGMFIEMKRQRFGRQSDAQKDFSSKVFAMGYVYFLAHGAVDAEKNIEAYLRPLKKD